MKYEVLLRPEAETDIGEAFQWYEAQATGLGEEFLRSMDACLASVQRSPMAYSLIYKDIRRALLRRFPYSVFYLIEADRVIVLACFHARRDPRGLRSRM